MKKNRNSLLIDIGWREWVSFPTLRIPAIEAQVISESRQSLLSIFKPTTFKEGEDLMISFGVHPLQDTNDIEIYAVMPVKTRRLVTTPAGCKEWCYVIEAEMRLGSVKKTIELTLVEQELLDFRLHLAAQHIKNQTRLDPQKSYLTGQIIDDYESVSNS